MKILSIGNSFTEDASYYFSKICKSANVEIKHVALHIGGSTLKMHAENIRENLAAYTYELNGIITARKVSVSEVLREENWDIVTLQQQSANTGIYESYGESIKNILAYIKENLPNALIYFYQTWAYELDSDNPDFKKFGNSQEIMFNSIEKTVERVCGENGDLPIIPAGRVIQAVRANPLFDYANGGQTLCRDGYHMHLIYGRYLVGLVWFATLLNDDLDRVTFVPASGDIVNGYTVPNFHCDCAKIEVIKAIVKNSLE